MRLLLDTHVAFWWFLNSEKIGKQCHARIIKAEDVYVSVISIWEIAEKVRKNKIIQKTPFDELIEASRFTILPLQLEHVRTYQALHAFHKDPFDRMLVAQTIYERLKFITADQKILQYPITTINPFE